VDSCLHFDLYLFTETLTHFIRPVLYFRATTGYRHDSIPDSISALQARAETDGVDFEFTEDPTRFNGDELGRFDGVMFLSTTGEGGEFKKKNIILVKLIAEPKPCPFPSSPRLVSSPSIPHLPSNRWQFRRSSRRDGLPGRGRLVRPDHRGEVRLSSRVATCRESRRPVSGREKDESRLTKTRVIRETDVHSPEQDAPFHDRSTR
jgi:hypothetical protein